MTEIDSYVHLAVPYSEKNHGKNKTPVIINLSKEMETSLLIYPGLPVLNISCFISLSSWHIFMTEMCPVHKLFLSESQQAELFDILYFLWPAYYVAVMWDNMCSILLQKQTNLLRKSRFGKIFLWHQKLHCVAEDAGSSICLVWVSFTWYLTIKAPMGMIK